MRTQTAPFTPRESDVLEASDMIEGATRSTLPDRGKRPRQAVLRAVGRRCSVRASNFVGTYPQLEGWWRLLRAGALGVELPDGRVKPNRTRDIFNVV